MKGLTRVDHDGKKMYGWLVRVYGGGKTFSKYFSDRKYGGKEKSRMLAIAHLEDLTKEIDEKYKDYIPRQNQPLYRRKPGRGNKTGVVGIHRCETVNHGKKVSYWAATWNDAGKPKDKKFYFGNGARNEEVARLLAMEWRARKIIELSPETVQPVAVWLEKEFKRKKNTKRSPAVLRGWVPGLEILEWIPGFSKDGEMEEEVEEETKADELVVKKCEPFNEKRILELVSFMGLPAALYDWSDIDYDFGRGIFKGDIRSRCFWNLRGIRSNVIIDANGKLIFSQEAEPDEYYIERKEIQESHKAGNIM